MLCCTIYFSIRLFGPMALGHKRCGAARLSVSSSTANSPEPSGTPLDPGSFPPIQISIPISKPAQMPYRPRLPIAQRRWCSVGAASGEPLGTTLSCGHEVGTTDRVGPVLCGFGLASCMGWEGLCKSDSLFLSRLCIELCNAGLFRHCIPRPPAHTHSVQAQRLATSRAAIAPRLAPPARPAYTPRPTMGSRSPPQEPPRPRLPEAETPVRQRRRDQPGQWHNTECS